MGFLTFSEELVLQSFISNAAPLGIWTRGGSKQVGLLDNGNPAPEGKDSWPSKLSISSCTYLERDPKRIETLAIHLKDKYDGLITSITAQDRSQILRSWPMAIGMFSIITKSH